MSPSATIITTRLFHRSTKAPAKGAIRTWGRSAIIEAKASTEAEPDYLVSHQTMENCTSRLPNRENACPVNIVKNLVID
jgi:hypothetical protein